MGIKEQFFKWFKPKRLNFNIGYVLKGEPKTEEDVEKLFIAYGLANKFQLFKPFIKPKIDVDLLSGDDKNIKIGQSKIGGRPDLKSGSSWPKSDKGKSLSFIGQVNCEEVSVYDKESIFPKKGLISFFYCSEQGAWGFDPNDKDRFKVIYCTNIHELQRIDFPKDLLQEAIFKSNKLKFSSSLSLPSWDDDSIDGLLSDKETESYIDLNEGYENQIFGYANNIQETMELECQLVTNGLYCGDPTGYNDPKRKELEEGIDDWVLLFQVDSDEEKTGMMWGDTGKLYFWIRKQDLLLKKFDKSWFILQSY